MEPVTVMVMYWMNAVSVAVMVSQKVNVTAMAIWKTVTVYVVVML
jgi:hypothetical protein